MPDYVLFPGIAALIVIGWVVALFAFSIMSGWSELSQHYRSKEKFRGTVARLQSGKLGVVGYRAMLSIGVNAQGLYLAVFLPARLRHPPLFIPWPEIKITRDRGGDVLLNFSRAATTPLRLREGLAVYLKNLAGKSWRESAK